VSALDGGLCRIKLPGGALTAAQAHALAACAAHYASGVIEATNRANLQLRGVRADQHAALVDRLIDAGLGSTAPGGDDAPQLMTSPIAGLDREALADTRALAAQILALLQHDSRAHTLSAKFALLLDGGERLAAIDHPHDVWLSPMAGDGGLVFVFGLAGCCPSEDRNARATPASAFAPGFAPSRACAAVLPSQVPALVGALLHTYIELAASDHTRMRDLLAVHSVEHVIGHVQARLDFPLLRGPRVDAWRRAPVDQSLRLGAHAQRRSGFAYVGAQPPLGRLDAPMLEGLAALAGECATGRLRVTPWQGVVLPDVRHAKVPTVLARLRSLGLYCSPADPLTRLIACAGSAGCRKGLADTKADALHLARRLPPHAAVHLTGCERSCAAAHRAPFTLLATGPGHYDLYRRDDSATSIFGVCVARQLTIEQAADWLARSTPDA
jgi:precorrin-3B synthase